MHNDFQRWTTVRLSTSQHWPELAENAAHVWRLELDRPIRPLHELSALLDTPERERAARFRFERDRHRFVAGRGQLRLLLGAYLGHHPAALKFGYGAAGKPHLVDTGVHEAGLDFNLSHSADTALLGVTRRRRIGVDVEAIRDTADLDDVAHQNFSAAEQKERMSLPHSQRLDSFFAVWTRKEAYLKAMGDGLLAPLDGFVVSAALDRPALLESIGGSADAASGWTLWSGTPREGFWAAAAIRGTGLTLDSLMLAA